MTQPKTMVIGPYLLVRPLAAKHLRIYEVYNADYDDTEPRLATVWLVDAPELGIPEEWRIRCAECPEESPNRRERATRAFQDRDRALLWLRRHREARHPRLEAA